jgi:alkylation response protein AidB-like acyl-CoA dehydrogenase
MWADADGGPKIVHAFLPRSHDGYRIVETWDTLGMRATRSDDVVLDGAFVPDKVTAQVAPLMETVDRSRPSTSQRVDGNAGRHTLPRRSQVRGQWRCGQRGIAG